MSSSCCFSVVLSVVWNICEFTGASSKDGSHRVNMWDIRHKLILNCIFIAYWRHLDVKTLKTGTMFSTLRLNSGQRLTQNGRALPLELKQRIFFSPWGFVSERRKMHSSATLGTRKEKRGPDCQFHACFTTQSGFGVKQYWLHVDNEGLVSQQLMSSESELLIWRLLCVRPLSADDHLVETRWI